MIKDPSWGGMMKTPLYSKVAGSMIKEFKLSPAEQIKTLPGRRTPGIPVPHLHFKDKVYPLNAKQWKAFSIGLMAEFQVKIGKARTVSFDQLQKVSEAVDSLAK
jgi:hypothetical protein